MCLLDKFPERKQYPAQNRLGRIVNTSKVGTLVSYEAGH